MKQKSDFKTCNGCNRSYPNNESYYSSTSVKKKNKTYSYLRSKCKFCLSKDGKKWYKRQRKSKRFMEIRRVYAKNYRAVHLYTVRLKDRLYKKIVRSIETKTDT